MPKLGGSRAKLLRLSKGNQQIRVTPSWTFIWEFTRAHSPLALAASFKEHGAEFVTGIL